MARESHEATFKTLTVKIIQNYFRRRPEDATFQAHLVPLSEIEQTVHLIVTFNIPIIFKIHISM